MASDYQIFLSYSHKDADLLGQAYINELKQQIEESIGIRDSVFLDTRALELGCDWNSSINECLDNSKVFIYLLSSNYIASEYCRREYLWWKQREARYGLLSSSSQPIYFIEVPMEQRSANAENWLLQTNDQPWFDIGVTRVLRDDAARRLSEAEAHERIRQFLTDPGANGKNIHDLIREKLKKYDEKSQSFSSVSSFNLNFVGRVKELAELRSICIKRHGLQDIPVIYGAAGCGKSDLAFAYASGYAAEYPGGRFMIHMENCRSWQEALLSMVTGKSGKSAEKGISTDVCEELLGISAAEFSRLSEEEGVRQVCRALELRCRNKGAVLLVLDNLVDLELFDNEHLGSIFENGIPDSLDIIATTRIRPRGLPFFGSKDAQQTSCAVAYFLGNLEEDSALELFRKHCIYADFNTCPPDGVPGAEKISAETQTLREIVRLLDHHAWSICHIAGAFSGCYKHLEPSPNEGEDPFEVGDKSCGELLAELKEYFKLNENKQLQSVNIEEYSDEVMRLTVELISNQENGKDILNFASAITLFSPDFVPLRLLEAFWEKAYADSSCSWSKARDLLQQHHILSGSKEKISRIHRLTWKYFTRYAAENNIDLAEKAGILSECTKHLTDQETISQAEAGALLRMGTVWCSAPWAENHVDLLLETLPWAGFLYCLLPELLEYGRTVKAKFAPLSQKDQSITVRLLNFDARYAHQSGSYAEAAEYCQKCLAILKEVLGENDPDIGAVYNNIAAEYNAQGKYDEALEYCQKSLEIALKNFGSDHLDTATAYNSIATIYAVQGKYSEALEYCQKCLAVRLEILGANHPDVAAVYNNMALAHKSLGKYDEALEYYQKSSAIWLKIFGENHPDVATAYNNIAALYCSQDKFDEALEYHQKSLAIRLEKLGANHPDVAITYNNMALVYDNLGKYDEALEYCQKSLAIRLEKLGPDHPAVAITYNNMALVYNNLRKYDQALEYHQKALMIRLEKLGANHPDIATTYNNIALVYDNQGKYDQALEFYQKSLTIDLEQLGPDHPAVATTCNNIALMYDNLEKYDEALEYYQKNLTISLKQLGPDHPSVASIYNNIAFVYYTQGKHTQALENYEKSLAILLKKFGANHPAVATIYNNIAASYDARGRYDEALEYFEKSLAIRLEKLDKKHPDVAHSFKKLASVYYHKGEFDIAREHIRKALDIILSSEKDDPNAESYFELEAQINKKMRLFGWWLKLKRMFRKS